MEHIRVHLRHRYSTTVLSVLLRYTDSDYPFGILKLFLTKSWWRELAQIKRDRQLILPNPQTRARQEVPHENDTVQFDHDIVLYITGIQTYKLSLVYSIELRLFEYRYKHYA